MNMNTRHKILIVDDEEEARSLLTELLGKERYDVATAADGDDAIALLEKQKFDLILLDIKMPHVSGFEVLKFVRENHPETRVIMLTAFAELANAMESRIRGADDFVGKPYDPNEVLMAMERLLGPRDQT